jgi:hypothetical protein
MTFPTTEFTDLPEFLSDWKSSKHRSLNDEHREQARRYIEAIVKVRFEGQDGELDQMPRQTAKRELWKKLRESYDDLAGLYSRTENEDFAKAMARI